MKYQKQKGKRIKRYGWGIQADGLWFSDIYKKWDAEIPDGSYSNTMSCRTIRAFKRALKKYPILKGRARWINKYVGYDVSA